MLIGLDRFSDSEGQFYRLQYHKEIICLYRYSSIRAMALWSRHLVG